MLEPCSVLICMLLDLTQLSLQDTILKTSSEILFKNCQFAFYFLSSYLLGYLGGRQNVHMFKIMEITFYGESAEKDVCCQEQMSNIPLGSNVECVSVGCFTGM